MKFSSICFFCALLCLVLGAISCSESKNAQLDRKFLDLAPQVAETVTKEQCSKKNLSATDCSKLGAANREEWHKKMQEVIVNFDETCKKSILLEEQCVEEKQEALKRLAADFQKIATSQ